MRRAIQIKASFLLAIFSLILVHQSIPHYHHEHQSDGEIANHHHSDTTHEHHHNHSDEQDKAVVTKSILNAFLEFHSHGNTLVKDHLPSYTILKKQKSFDVELASIPILDDNFGYVDVQKKNKLPLYTPPDIVYKTYLAGLELRGPPVLG
ncbi:hypothetical protein [Tenacibaculum larymnensis]|uniref:Uncharacterized protein n=1 Tax=Tenacibaculum larymnensis TaxID=2878201 RepID=A0A9X4ERR0_9FLAO|nr:hypothetical protein [Tenacibaculum larymnensis]MDE1207647.1 hypothetical protein [Tenacibaculum larymnensis]